MVNMHFAVFLMSYQLVKLNKYYLQVNQIPTNSLYQFINSNASLLFVDVREIVLPCQTLGILLVKVVYICRRTTVNNSVLTFILSAFSVLINYAS